MSLKAHCKGRQAEYLDAFERHGNYTAAALELGVNVRTLTRALAKVRHRAGNAELEQPAQPKVSRIRSSNLSFEQLVKDRIDTYRRKRTHEDDLAALTITLPQAGPYGIVFLGDPHVDDDGCDWKQLQFHIELIKATEGLYAVNLGDVQNGWAGRLERLYANQRTTAHEALILVEGFVNALMGKWLFHIGGNHDLWAGKNDPLPHLCQAAQATYIPIGGKVKIRAGKHELYINARHTFPGNSMWNTAHGAGRSIQMGNTEHIAVCGHKHTTGQMVIKAPTGRICHALQVASYKIIDEYAKEGGFRDNHIAPACMVVVDPRFPDTDPAMLTVFHSIERGASYLRFLREQM